MGIFHSRGLFYKVFSLFESCCSGTLSFCISSVGWDEAFLGGHVCIVGSRRPVASLLTRPISVLLQSKWASPSSARHTLHSQKWERVRFLTGKISMWGLSQSTLHFQIFYFFLHLLPPQGLRFSRDEETRFCLLVRHGHLRTLFVVLCFEIARHYLRIIFKPDQLKRNLQNAV